MRKHDVDDLVDQGCASRLGQVGAHHHNVLLPFAMAKRLDDTLDPAATDIQPYQVAVSIQQRLGHFTGAISALQGQDRQYLIIRLALAEPGSEAYFAE